MTIADDALTRMWAELGLEEASPAERYAQISDAVQVLGRYNDEEKFQPATTGAISERLCRLGLNAALPDSAFQRLPQRWRWLGDYRLSGSPLHVVVSVKSFKARERLLASGSGSLLAPTLGWGLFDDPAEWRAERVMNYLYRGFFRIYMPEALFEDLGEDAHSVENTNGNDFLRPLQSFVTDLVEALNDEQEVVIDRL